MKHLTIHQNPQFFKETVFGEVNLRKETTAPLKDVLLNPQTIIDKDLKKKLKELIKQGRNEKQIKAYFEEYKESWQDVNLKKIPVYYFTKDTKDRFFATRKTLDDSFDKKSIMSITDTGIQAILLRHLENEGGDPKVAFSPEGIERMNKNIVTLNGGHAHQPVYKVRKYELSSKFAVGQKGNKAKKFVEAAKGTNLFFAVYEQECVDKKTGEIIKERQFDSILLNVAISRLKEGLSPAPDNQNGLPPIFVLSPNDLVYVPTPDELKDGILPSHVNSERIYKMVSCTENEAHFIPISIAYPIVQTTELGSNNKAQRAWTSEMIKEICIPLQVNRLGKITFK